MIPRGEAGAALAALASCACLVTAGCVREPSLKPDQKFVHLYVDLRLATEGNPSDTARASKARNLILAQYGVTSGEFRRNLQAIIDNPDSWLAFQQAVAERAERVESIHKGE